MEPPPTPLVARRSAVRDANSLPSDRVVDLRDDQAAEQDMNFVTDADAEGSKRINPIFILDSGASCHATGNFRLFHMVHDVAAAKESRRTVCGANGMSLQVTGIGTIAIENFHIPDVLYIPELMPEKTIVSVSKLADLGYDVVFGGGQARVMDHRDKKPIGQGPLMKRDDGFYYCLEFLKIPTLLGDEAAAAEGKMPIDEEAAAAADGKMPIEEEAAAADGKIPIEEEAAAADGTG